MVTDADYQHQPTTFFSDQLTSFEIWVEFGSQTDPSPDQLPCLIQGLSSQTHRIRILHLLTKYLDLGYWAVNDALSCGIMPYIIKLLGSPELIFLLIPIWIKILAVDRTEVTLLELFRTNSQFQLLKVLTPLSMQTPDSPVSKAGLDGFSGLDVRDETSLSGYTRPGTELPHNTTVAQCQAMACYILYLLMDTIGLACQASLWNHQLLGLSLLLLDSTDANLRKWVCIAVGRLLDGLHHAKHFGCLENVYERMARLLVDPIPDVRAACIFALSKFIGDTDQAPVNKRQMKYVTEMALRGDYERPAPEQADDAESPTLQRGGPLAGPLDNESRASKFNYDFHIWLHLSALVNDISPTVRHELAYAVGLFLQYYRAPIKVEWLRQLAKPQSSSAGSLLFKSSPDTMSTLSREHFSDNPALAASEPPQFFVSPILPGFPQAGATSPAQSPSKPKSSGIADAQRRPQFTTAATLVELAERKAALAADLCRVLSILACDPYPRVAETSGNIVAWVQNICSGNNKDIIAVTEQVLQSQFPRKHANKHQQVTTGTEEPKVDPKHVASSQPHNHTAACYDERRQKELQQQSRLEWLTAVFSDNSSRQYAPGQGAQLQVAHTCISPQMRAGEVFTAARFLAFHPYLALADSNNIVHVCNYEVPRDDHIEEGNDLFGSHVQRVEDGAALNTFAHVNSSTANVKGLVARLHVVNDHSEPALVVADIFGQVSVYGNFIQRAEQFLVTSFRVGEVPSGAKVVTDWQQTQPLLYFAGIPGKIHVYDLQEERPNQVINFTAEIGVTALHCDKTGGHVLVAGFSDGTIRMWDKRQSGMAHHSLVAALEDPARGRAAAQRQIVNVVQRGNTILSGSVNGLIKVWDVRQRSVQKQFELGKNLQYFEVHNNLPLVACGCEGEPALTILNTKWETLETRNSPANALKKKDGMPPEYRLTFHPFKSLLASGREILTFV
eukprot:TRINITY_DN3712_c0_g1_i3.p1 TRINITY_DN3712_c0_g1~~TRINITY_DN3712_c0_g1_i3.p1  ORF type:complete len:957 (+),score=138.94 TRINITY_DN3712_c0_g1_i3:86-2956(+)